MEKIIKFTIENTTKTREVEDTYSELYSHDRNNGLFEFEIANEQLAGKNLIALFKFVKTGSYWKTEAVVEDNKAKIKFDTSLITQNEKVICFIYVNEEIRDADIFRFKFNVRVSEIDKAKQLPLKERFYAHGLIVDRLDVLTKEDFDKALAEISKGSHFLTENQANEKYALKGDIPNVSNLVSSTQLSDYALKTEIPNSETIVNKAVEEVEKKGYLTEHQSLNGYVTETQLEGKNYLTEHQDISKLATKKAVKDVEAKVTQLENRPVTSSYDDSEIKRKIKELEDRPTTANIDTSNFVTNTQLEDKHYLTEHQDISGLATKEQLKKAFLDEEEHEKYAKKTELPQPYNDTDIKSRLTVLENKPSGSSSELRGHGVPTDTQAPIGTTYIDEDVTNGALKWIKTKTVWKVIEGDTGWVDIPITRFIGQSKMQVKRVNDIVHVRFLSDRDSGLIQISDYYNNKPPYLTVFTTGIFIGWSPTQKIIQTILPEVDFSNSEYTYDSSQVPHPYLRLNPQFGGVNIEFHIDEFTVRNTSFGVYINSFSYLTEDAWPSSLVIR